MRAAWSAGTTADPQRLASAFAELLQLGLLVPVEVTPVRPLKAPARPVDVVAIVTADRPESLRRCILQLDAHCKEWGHTPRLVVVDGSRVERARERNRLSTDRFESGSSFYLGEREAARARKKLERLGCPADVLAFGLTPGDIGSNRNLALLLTAGSVGLFLDDDVMCVPWRHPQWQQGLVVGDHRERRTWQFFRSRAEAVPAPAAVDLLTEHGSLLGAALYEIADFCAGAVDVSNACSHLVDALADGGRSTVRATFAGIAGDTARYCPSQLLLLGGTVADTLAADAATLTSALSFREVRRISTQLLVTHDGSFASYCMGLDNRGVLPPFMPSGRNEDGVFGAMVVASDPDAVFAHLPVGVVHASDRASAYPSSLPPSATGSRIAEVFLGLLPMLALGPRSSAPEQRLRRLGAGLQELSGLSSGDFGGLVFDCLTAQRARWMENLEAVHVGAASAPFIQLACDEYRQQLLRGLQKDGYFVPVEFMHRQDPMASIREHVAMMGAFCVCWPELVSAALTGELCA